jgi:hypothetical protein
VIENATILAQVERLQPEHLCQPATALSRLLRLGRDGRPCSVELRRPAIPLERLQGVDTESAFVWVERGERDSAAHMGNPRAAWNTFSGFMDRPVGDAQDHEISHFDGRGQPLLAKPRGNRRSQSAVSDDSDPREHEPRYCFVLA